MTNPIWAGRLTLAFLALFCVTFAASAQDEPRPYKQWPIDPQYQELLKKRFKADEQFGELKDLVQHLMANPDKLPIDPEKLKGMKLDDANLKKLAEDWLANDPKLQKSVRDWVKQNPADRKQQPDMKKLQRDLKKIVDDMEKKGSEPPTPSAAPKGPNPLDPAAPKDDPLAKIAERALKQTEKSRLGEWLRDSPAWNRAFEDLRGSMNDPDAPRWKLEGWQAKLVDPEGGAWQFGEKTLRNLPKPDLGRFNWTPSTPDAGNIPLPNLTAGGPSDFSFSATTTWILFVVLFLLVGWRLMRFGKRKAATAEARPDLGPWPVSPDAVATRADLVRAFDYLALWTLGLAVASWNHHAVVRRWAEKSPACAQASQALALLYEQARYTTGAESLTEIERALARQTLTQIAEAL